MSGKRSSRHTIDDTPGGGITLRRDGGFPTVCRRSAAEAVAAWSYTSGIRGRVRTQSAKAGTVERQWWIVDAEGQNLGRLASVLADTLRGKRSAWYTPHADTGDFVVVVNAEKIAVTGNKMREKRYWRHSGYPGGIRSRTLSEQLARRPEEVLRKAVRGMLPKNSLGRKQLLKLKLYAGPEHPHEAQEPKPLRLTRVAEVDR